MRVFVVALALSAGLSAAPAFAQAQAPAPAAPQAQAPAPPTPPTPRFQDGLKYGYIQLQQVAAFSNQGQALEAKVQGLQQQKVKELQDKQKTLTAAQERLEKGGTLLSDQARAQLQADIERQQRDLQRSTEDAQQEITALTQQLQNDFFRVLLPVIEQVAKQKQVHFVFNAQESGLVWADASLDLTAEVIQALDSSKPAAPAPTAKPAAPAPAPTAKPAAPAPPGK